MRWQSMLANSLSCRPLFIKMPLFQLQSSPSLPVQHPSQTPSLTPSLSMPPSLSLSLPLSGIPPCSTVHGTSGTEARQLWDGSGHQNALITPHDKAATFVTLSVLIEIDHRKKRMKIFVCGCSMFKHGHCFVECSRLDGNVACAWIKQGKTANKEMKTTKKRIWNGVWRVCCRWV